jgi:hypothetical protein
MLLLKVHLKDAYRLDDGEPDDFVRKFQAQTSKINSTGGLRSR